MKAFFNKIHYSDSLSFAELSVRILLIPLSLLYLAIVCIRNLFYKINLLKKTGLPAKVISVGNLTTGGTGKTPVIIELAKYLKEKKAGGLVVLSHGYGGKLYKKGVNVVSDTEKILMTPALAGDEACILAENLRGIPVLSGKNRIEAGKYAVEKFGAKILLLDDGFQHIRLERNLDILLVDCSLLFGNGFVLPAGPLREPLSEINRAGKIILVNKNPLNSSADALCESFASEIKERFNKPVFLCRFMPDKIYNIKDLASISTAVSTVFAFAGVGQPASFFSFIGEKGYKIAGRCVFDDHYSYSEKDIMTLIKTAKEKHAEALITTEKDAVKIKELIRKTNFDIDFYYLKISLDLDTEKILEDIL